MKPTKIELAEPEVEYSYAPSAETLAAIERLNVALERRAKLDSAVNAVPHEIAVLEAAVNRQRGELNDLQAEAALACNSENEVPQLQDFDKCRAALNLLMQDLELARGKLASLENRAAAIDAEVVDAGSELNRESNMDGYKFQAQVSVELRAALPPLQAVITKARALSTVGFGSFLGDFLNTIQLYDPVGLMAFATGPQGHDLLAADQNDMTEHAVVERLKVVQKAQTAVRTHRPYVPLDARPKPYVIKGSNFPGDRAAPPLPQPTPPPPMKQSFEQALRQPYEVRGDSGGRTRNAGAVDLNVGAAITANLMRGD
ncbi:MAG: hypothetical protein JWR14_5766 [Caballeronia sp.]|jgi:hypothetical protein|uniref:hypothetical protein n=1 Tax=Caballeronia sp. TaxID=1931223 RepID=UPI0026153798|nr:hypothetical protein [Caballeronia sp.]MDB5835936.1 hypothetical protein [Caballeronia sp.]